MTVIHLVSAVVGTVTSEGTVILCVLCVCVTVTVTGAVCFASCRVIIICGFEGTEDLYFVQVCMFTIQVFCKNIFISVVSFCCLLSFVVNFHNVRRNPEGPDSLPLCGTM